jgi:DNA-binding MarR family transcriptional regulator
VEAWEALLRSQVALLRRLADDDVWDPVSMREFDVLHTLSRCPDGRARLHRLNREVLLSQPSLSRLVDRLVDAGYVVRERDDSDGRGTVVVLTEEGSRVRRLVGAKHAERIGHYAGEALDERELRALRLLCDKLRLAQDAIPA